MAEGTFWKRKEIIKEEILEYQKGKRIIERVQVWVNIISLTSWIFKYSTAWRKNYDIVWCGSKCL